MKQRIELRAEMGDAVLAHLRQFGDLPTTGVLAGQAVASAIDDLWGRQGTGVYNDLDVFRHVRYRANIANRRANATAARTNMGVVERESNYDRMSQMLALVDSYGIQSVNRDSMLNFVNCTLPAHLSGGALSPTRVIAGFDLNCVRVAVDLYTKRLVWDRSFERYLASRQIEIAMVHTPWHTFLRLLKKLDELPGTYADVDAAAAICTGVAHSSFLAKLQSTARVSLRFGAKHKELADRFCARWAPYVDLQESHWVREARQWTDLADLAGAEPEAASASSQRVSLWQMSSRAGLDHRLQSRLDRMGQAVVMLGPQAVYCERRKKSAAVNLKLDALKAQFGKQRWSDVMTHASMLGPAYVEGQALPSVAQKVEAFFIAHRRMSGLMAGLTIAHQHACIERVKATCAEFDGVASIGVLENNACAVDLESPDHIRTLLDADRRVHARVIDVEPLRLPGMPECFANYKVDELLTPCALKQEGLDMSHCVAGYHARVRSNDVRILRIRGNPGDKCTWSTAEVTRDCAYRGGHKVPHGTSVPLGPRARLRVLQHRGRFNDEPMAMNEAVLRFVVLMHGEMDLSWRAARARSGTRTATQSF